VRIVPGPGKPWTVNASRVARNGAFERELTPRRRTRAHTELSSTTCVSMIVGLGVPERSATRGTCVSRS
jgi:hypothetical protein